VTRQLLRTPLATVQIERQRWAVKDQIPLGVLTILAGTAGIAKSTILAWYIARFTTGELEGDLHGTPCPVAIIAGEDDNAKMLVPRLKVAGANVDLIESFDGVRVYEEGEQWDTSANLADDLASIRAALIETGARVLIIDPIITLMRGDSHRLEDVRRNLDPLASMAKDLEIAVICVMHFNKGAGNAGEKVSGSHAFRDIARSLMVLAVDEETDDRILTVEKSNYSAVKPSLAFKVESVDVPTARGEFTTVGKAIMLGASQLTVQDILSRDTSALGQDQSDLIQYVNDHPEGVSVEHVALALNKEKNYTRNLLSRAAKAGRITREMRGMYTPLSTTHAPPPTSGASGASGAFTHKQAPEAPEAPLAPDARDGANTLADIAA
jgi:hypothetical protein